MLLCGRGEGAFCGSSMTVDMLVCAAKQAFKALMYREWLLMRRNMFVYVFKAVQVII